MTAQPTVSAALIAMPLGEIARTRPGATAVFRRHGLDFCCGGGHSLAEAATEKGLAPDTIAAELAALDPGNAPTVPREPARLIDHILARYHEVHRQELPELIKLAMRVEVAHRGHPKVPAGIADALRELETELVSHMLKEEQVLFPLMRAGGAPMIVHPIARMRHEHDEHGERLRRIEVMTDDFTLPEDACPTWAALYTGLSKLVNDLMEHVHLENNVLFPQFAADADLPAAPVCGMGG
ncbi:MAG: iron-sulfur cluster repair protein YtfE [Bauldia litoralis]